MTPIGLSEDTLIVKPVFSLLADLAWETYISA
jgi:hypothetical protein